VTEEITKTAGEQLCHRTLHLKESHLMTIAHSWVEKAIEMSILLNMCSTLHNVYYIFTYVIKQLLL